MTPQSEQDNGEEETPVHTVVARRRLSPLPSGFSSYRDLASFLAGLVVIGNEVFFQAKIEYAVLGLGLTLCGLPWALRADENKKGAPPA